MVEIVYKEESYSIIGACMKVHQKLGPGFLEAVYQEALVKEFTKLALPFQKEKKLALYYDGEKMNKYYRADFLCYNKVVLEVKALEFIARNLNKQLFNYLKATTMKLGILVNFGKSSLEYKRILNPYVS